MFNASSGQMHDRFLYAAMLSRARIEQAWAGSVDDVELAQDKESERQAFDPEMLQKLAQRAAHGEITEVQPQMSASAPSASSSASPRVTVSALTARSTAGFSKEAIEAAKAFEASKMASSTSDSHIPAAFRKKGQARQGGLVAFAQQTATAASVTSFASDRFLENSLGAAQSSMEDLKNSFQEKIQETVGKVQQQIVNGHNAASGSEQIQSDQSEVERKNEAAAAVQNIVSLKLEQVKKTVAANKNFHAVAPEPKAAEQKRRRKLDASDGERLDAVANAEAGDIVDPVPADKATDSSGSAVFPSRRELAALARSEPKPDVPLLGELRAPGEKTDPGRGPNKTERSEKTGAQLDREKRDRVMGRRSRSRERQRRPRSPSSSSERAGRRVFTDKPAFRMTGSTFSSSAEKSSASKPQVKASKFSNEELPDWLKDMAEPQGAPKLGKKYLHMPRIMIEVLTHNNGESMRACAEKAQCQIRVETMIEEPVGILSVNGNVTLGEKVIREMLASKGLELPPQDGLVLPYAPAEQSNHNDNQQDILIPETLIKHFLGHKGMHLKAIHSKLDAMHGGVRAVSIQILPAILPGGLRRIQVTGSSRIQARQMILQHIEDVKRQQSTYPRAQQAPFSTQAPVPMSAASGMRI